MRRSFQSLVSRTCVMYLCSCIQHHIQLWTGFRSGLLGGHRSGDKLCCLVLLQLNCHASMVCCTAEAHTFHWRHDAWLAASASSAKPRGSISHPPLYRQFDEEQLSAVQFWDSNGHHQWWGERWPTTHQALGAISHFFALLGARYHCYSAVETFLPRGRQVNIMFRKCRFRDKV